jgi:hypothetical protein
MSTKKNLTAALVAAGIAIPRKANVATLTALCEQHGLTTGTPADEQDEELHLETESVLDVDGDEGEEEAPRIAPLPVSSKPTQVAVGLVIEKNRPEQNGIKRPSAGGRCRAVWDALDDYRRDEGVLPDAKFVRALAVENNWNPNNASIEFYQWRKFNGITGRQAKPVAPVAAPAEAE